MALQEEGERTRVRPGPPRTGHPRVSRPRFTSLPGVTRTPEHPGRPGSPPRPHETSRTPTTHTDEGPDSTPSPCRADGAGRDPRGRPGVGPGRRRGRAVPQGPGPSGPGVHTPGDPEVQGLPAPRLEGAPPAEGAPVLPPRHHHPVRRPAPPTPAPGPDTRGVDGPALPLPPQPWHAQDPTTLETVSGGRSVSPPCPETRRVPPGSSTPGAKVEGRGVSGPTRRAN